MFRSQTNFPFLRFSFSCWLTRRHARQLEIALGGMTMVVGSWMSPGPTRAADFTWELSPVSTSWDTAANWAGPSNQIPDDNADTANVSGLNSFYPQLMSQKTLGALVVSDGGRVSTGSGTSNFSLTVQDNGGQTGLLWLSSDGPALGPEGNLTFMTVYDSPSTIDVDTDDLQIDSMSELRIRQGARVQVDRNLDLNFGGMIEGVGILEMNGAGTAINDGTLRASGGTLTIRRTGSSTTDLDLDGTTSLGEPGHLAVDNNSKLVIEIPLSGAAFDGTVTLGQNSELMIRSPWTLMGTSGTQIDINAGTGTATISGGGLEGRNNINVNSGTMVLAAPALMTSTARVTLGANTRLRFDAPTTIGDPASVVESATYGYIVNNTVNIGSGTGDLDWDGPGSADGSTVVNAGGRLNIHVGRVDTSNDTYDGTVTVNSGILDVRTAANAWTLRGSTLQLNNSSGTQPELLGSRILVASDASIQGSGVVRAPITNDGLLAATGGGTLEIRGMGTDLDGTVGVGQAGRIEAIQGNVLVHTGESHSFGGVLTVGPSREFRVADSIVAAATSIVHVNGGSSVETGAILTAGTITNVGQLNVTGHAIMRTSFTSLEGGTLNLPSAADVLHLMPHPELAPAEWNQVRVFEESDITGLGTLFIHDRVGFRAEYDVNEPPLGIGSIDVHVNNQGAFVAGGDVRVKSFSQSRTGTYGGQLVSVVGHMVPQTYNYILRVDESANLDGILALFPFPIDLYSDPLLPGEVDTWTTITAASVSGRFDEVLYYNHLLEDYETLEPTLVTADSFLSHVGDGLYRLVEYSPTAVTFTNYRALPGDANGDFVVDGSDFGIWNANKFTGNADWTMGDFSGDGLVDGSDFGIWNANKFTTADRGLLRAQVPEPMSAWTLTYLGFVISWTRRTCKRGCLGRPSPLGAVCLCAGSGLSRMLECPVQTELWGAPNAPASSDLRNNRQLTIRNPKT